MKLQYASIGIIILLGVVGIWRIFLSSTGFQAVWSEDWDQRISQVYEDLPQQQSSENTRYAEESLIGGTNQWFSSALWSQASEPLFVYPYILKFEPTGFGISLPEIVSTPKTVYGSYTPQLHIEAPQANLTTAVREYDDLRAVFTLRQDSTDIASISLIRGVPIIYGTLSKGQQLYLKGLPFRVDGSVAISDPGQYGVWVSDPQIISVENDLLIFQTDDRSVDFSIVVAESELDLNNFLPLAQSPVIRTQVTVENKENNLVKTHEIITRNGTAVPFGDLPHARIQDQSSIGSFKTLRGVSNVYEGNVFRSEIPLIGIDLDWDYTKLTSSEREEVIQALREDIKTISFKDDTYFGGKALARVAYLILIADGLGQTDIRDTLLATLEPELTKWFDNDQSGARSFYYDPSLDSMVGRVPSFGSEEANDHHFHYGYFVFAASIVGQMSSEFVQEYGPKVDALVADYGNITRDNSFVPYLRVFDLYEGHSWASGKGLFRDGNNQESTSEAINAWYAMYRWGMVRNNPQLQLYAQWLYSEEIQSARSYWLTPDRETLGSEYQPSFVTLVWGGKLDYATWFSDTSEAKLGIQLLPLHMGHQYLATDIGQVQKLIGTLDSSEYRQFEDYLLTYASLIDPKSREQFRQLNQSDLDDGYSKSAGLLYIYQLTDEK